MKPLKLSLMPILIASILILSGASESGEPTNPKEAKQQSKKPDLHQNESGNDQLPSAASVIDQSLGSSIDRRATNSQTPKQEAHASDPPSDATWYFNLLIAVFTGCLVCVGIAQVAVYVNQARIMRRGFRVARRSAEAAKKSADASMRGQRAYVYAYPRQIDAFKFIGKDIPSLIIEIKNVGETPAYKCTFAAWSKAVDHPSNCIFLDKDLIIPPNLKGITLFPKEPYPAGTPIVWPKPLTTEQLTAWEKGELAICFRVRIQYETAFENGRYTDMGYSYDVANPTNARMLTQYHDAN
jgi:hypothetical protein